MFQRSSSSIHSSSIPVDQPACSVPPAHDSRVHINDCRLDEIQGSILYSGEERGTGDGWVQKGCIETNSCFQRVGCCS
jgi:hypothetical protein